LSSPLSFVLSSEDSAATTNDKNDNGKTDRRATFEGIPAKVVPREILEQAVDTHQLYQHTVRRFFIVYSEHDACTTEQYTTNVRGCGIAIR